MKQNIINARVTFRKSPIHVLEKFAFKDMPDACLTFKKNISSEDIYQIKLQKFARFEAKQVLPTQLDRKKFLYAVMNNRRVKELLKEGKYKKAQGRVKKMLREQI